ncbi:MAG: hypothetical protein JXQ75_08330 [Phycisphaerae bacterium]|nr:hypothetical protein [Phycisphaerae bacterium]
MPIHRKLLLLLAVLLVGGSLGLTARYGLRIRSHSYRVDVEQGLSEFFELPCDVGQIRGYTFESRAFENVDIWLPDRRERVFSCKTAIWHEKEKDGQPWNELDLIDGLLLLGGDKWLRDDYRQILKSSLGHDFEELDLHRVGMSNFEISFVRRDVAIRCRNTSGTISMSDPDDGIARLVAYELNGHRITQGVQIDARFLPKNGIEVSEFVLTLPEVPLSCIGIGPALGAATTTGRFAGQVEYRRTDSQPEIWLAGDLIDVDLAELTGAVPLGPFVGRLSVSVEWAKLTDSVVTHFRGRGEITDFLLLPFAPLLGQETLSGTATFRIDPIDLALGHVNRLRLDGSVSGLTLQELMQPWGAGMATGKLDIRVNNLDVADDNIRSADVEVTVVPPPGEAGTIDRQLLLSVAEQVLDFTWPEALPKRILPEKVEYTEFGMRLLVRDNRLRILGTHGKDGDTILTIKVLGSPIGLVKERAGTIDLGPHLAVLLDRIRSYDTDRMRQWWRSERERQTDDRPGP